MPRIVARQRVRRLFSTPVERVLYAAGRGRVLASDGNKIEARRQDLGNRDEFRFAGDCAPGGLYKYRRFESKEERDRIKRTLEHGEIYFPSRLELNDPFELKVAFELNSDKKAVIAGLVKSAQRAGKAGGAKARQVMEWQAKLRRRDPAELMNYVQREHNKRMETDCFIYCLCAEDDNPILWAHYADSHKGMCIGFDSTVHPFHGACGLDYADKYPTTQFPRVEGGEDMTSKSGGKKSQKRFE